MTHLEIVREDITALRVGAIVNAANETLLGGGGVDGAIHRAAGPELAEACRRLPEVSPGVRCPSGEVRITSGYKLAARFVIHTVGPVWRGGSHGEAEQLATCYRASLKLAADNDLRSIAFPAISCGAYGYPLRPACAVALRTTQAFLQHDRRLDRIVFVAFSEPVAAALRAAHRDALDAAG